jgi:predicted aminopeptidase
MRTLSQGSIAHLLPVLLLLLCGCKTGYVLDQGSEFLQLMSQREPINESLSSDQLTDHQEQQLRLIQDVRSFSEREIGLQVGDAYTTYVHLDRQAVSWNITGTTELSTQPLTWTFPIAGRFPYIGFFDRGDAEEYHEQLQLDGYDVEMRPVNAFSTLGWFSDPVFSPMLNSSDPLLVNTVIHELVHRTIFISGHTSLNEAIATEIGRIATISFLRRRHGSSAPIVQRTKQYFEDVSRVQDFFLNLRKQLNAVYTGDHTPGEKRHRKQRVIMHARRSFVNLLDRLKTTGWERLLSTRWNNAFVASRAVYYQHTGLVRRLWTKAFQRNLPRTIDFLKSLDSHQPMEQIRKRIDQAETESGSVSPSTASR